MHSFAENLLHPTDNAIIQHYFDAVRVARGFRQDPLHGTFRQLAGPLILLFDNTDSQPGLDVCARRPVHVDRRVTLEETALKSLWEPEEQTRRIYG